MAAMDLGSDGTAMHNGKRHPYGNLIADNGLSAKVVPV